MSNDLISRSAVIEEFYKRVSGDFMVDDVEKIEKVIMDVPVAYDVDKVVASLELLSENAENDELNTYEEKAAYCTAYSKAIEVVRGGGTDED